MCNSIRACHGVSVPPGELRGHHGRNSRSESHKRRRSFKETRASSRLAMFAVSVRPNWRKSPVKVVSSEIPVRLEAKLQPLCLTSPLEPSSESAPIQHTQKRFLCADMQHEQVGVKEEKQKNNDATDLIQTEYPSAKIQL